MAPKNRGTKRVFKDYDEYETAVLSSASIHGDSLEQEEVQLVADVVEEVDGYSDIVSRI